MEVRDCGKWWKWFTALDGEDWAGPLMLTGTERWTQTAWKQTHSSQQALQHLSHLPASIPSHTDVHTPRERLWQPDNAPRAQKHMFLSSMLHAHAGEMTSTSAPPHFTSPQHRSTSFVPFLPDSSSRLISIHRSSAVTPRLFISQTTQSLISRS